MCRLEKQTAKIRWHRTKNTRKNQNKANFLLYFHRFVWEIIFGKKRAFKRFQMYLIFDKHCGRKWTAFDVLLPTRDNTLRVIRRMSMSKCVCVWFSFLYHCCRIHFLCVAALKLIKIKFYIWHIALFPHWFTIMCSCSFSAQLHAVNVFNTAQVVLWWRTFYAYLFLSFFCCLSLFLFVSRFLFPLFACVFIELMPDT